MRNLPPLLQKFKDLAGLKGRYEEIVFADKVGVTDNTVRNWLAARVDPRLSLFNAALNAIGHRLVIVPIKGDDVSRKALELCESVSHDGVLDGGLTSSKTIRHSDELRLLIIRKKEELT